MSGLAFHRVWVCFLPPLRPLEKTLPPPTASSMPQQAKFLLGTFGAWLGCGDKGLVPPPPLRGDRHLGPESIGNTRRPRRQRGFLQGAEADLHCDTMVQICGAEQSLCDRPDKRGDISRWAGGGVGVLGSISRCTHRFRLPIGVDVHCLPTDAGEMVGQRGAFVPLVTDAALPFGVRPMPVPACFT